MTSLFSLLLAGSILVYGCMIFRTWLKLARSKVLFPSNMLYPADRTEKDCKDPEGFIRYVRPRYLILSLVCILYGAARLYLEWTGKINYNGAPAMIVAVVFIVLIFLYTFRLSKETQRFF